MLGEIWFVLWGVLWGMYFMLDGFDLGTGALLPFLGGSEEDRGQMLNAIGPFWDGNEVWLIAAGGVTFAAFPGTYAVMFSALYTPLLLVLFCLILRGVSIEFRGHVEGRGGRKLLETIFFLSSLAAALLLGVAFANIFRGIPIDGEGIFNGTILALFNPYGLLGGLLFVLLFVVHGALWIAVRTKGDLEDRAGAAATGLWPVLLIVAVAFLAATWFYTDLYENYIATPVLLLIPLVAVAGLLLVRVFAGPRAWWKAWFSSCAAIFGAAMFGVIGMFPRLLPSSLSPDYSMTITNSSSTPLTLSIMLGVSLVFVPLVIGYQSWAYKTFSYKLKKGEKYGSSY